MFLIRIDYTIPVVRLLVPYVNDGKFDKRDRQGSSILELIAGMLAIARCLLRFTTSIIQRCVGVVIGGIGVGAARYRFIRNILVKGIDFRVG